jgi:hypothetical protein
VVGPALEAVAAASFFPLLLDHILAQRLGSEIQIHAVKT